MAELHSQSNFHAFSKVVDDVLAFVCCQFWEHGDGQGSSAECDCIGMGVSRHGIPLAIARHGRQCVGVVHSGLDACLLRSLGQAVPILVLDHVEVVDG